MTSLETVRKPEEDTGIAKGFLIVILWGTGLASTLYLVGLALFWLFLAVVFASDHPSMATLDYLEHIAMNSTPAISYGAIGTTGFIFMRSNRFWILGQSAILAEIALASYAFANPATLPMFTDLLL